MTFDQIVTEICEQLNLTSDEAKSRVGRRVNNRYRRLTTSIGLETSRNKQVNQVATIGNRYLTFTGIEKILAVIDKTDPNQDIVLEQITFDEMHIVPQRQQPPRQYSIYTVDPTSVQIYMDCVPTEGALSATVAAAGSGYVVGDDITLVGGTLGSAGEPTAAIFKVSTINGSGGVTAVTITSTAGTYTALPANPVSTTGGTGTGCTLTVTWGTPFTLYADGVSTVTTLSGSDVPDFPESFHDILVFGAMADEYRKMEKAPLMQVAEQNYEMRLSDLRMFIAKSAYLDQYQGRYDTRQFRWSRDSMLLWDQ